MNLIRLLVIVAIVWLVYRMYQNWLSSNKIARKQRARQAEIKNMVQCSRCGLHLPENEALRQGGKFYCSEAHKN